MPAVKPKESVNESLAAVVAHPLRARCLMACAERTRSPRELATLFGREVHNVAHHVRVLEKMGFVEEVGSRPVRGATEHFFRAIERPMVTEEEYALLSQEERNGFAKEVCQLGFADASSALSTETFSTRPDNIVARTPMILDEEGFKAVAALHGEAVLKSMQIEAESNERRAHTGDPGTAYSSFVLCYERDLLTD